MDYYIATLSDIGIKRKENQDAVFAASYCNGRENAAFAVLCDGMGGLSHGAMASASVVHAFTRWAEEQLPVMDYAAVTEEQLCAVWTELVRNENDTLRAFGKNNGCSAGSTLVVALLTERRYYIMNVGDSRAYFVTSNIRQITEDHTVIAEEVRKGNLSEEQAEQAPIKNILTRCIGVYPQVQPDFFFGKIEPKTICLLCSDGFRHLISKAEMRDAFLLQKELDSTDLGERVKYLVELNKSRGETDNISAVAINVKS